MKDLYCYKQSYGHVLCQSVGWKSHQLLELAPVCLPNSRVITALMNCVVHRDWDERWTHRCMPADSGTGLLCSPKGFMYWNLNPQDV